MSMMSSRDAVGSSIFQATPSPIFRSTPRTGLKGRSRSYIRGLAVMPRHALTRLSLTFATGRETAAAQSAEVVATYIAPAREHLDMPVHLSSKASGARHDISSSTNKTISRATANRDGLQRTQCYVAKADHTGLGQHHKTCSHSYSA